MIFKPYLVFHRDSFEGLDEEGRLGFWPLDTEFLHTAAKRIDMHP